MEKLWWKQKAIYQIYPRSFCDSNNDGIGDIPGIISKLDYLKDLGVGGIWLSPVYKSPNDDMGYDISDYYDINPEYGTLDDMKRLFQEAKKRDIHIIMDLVINHTSDEHPWFIESKKLDSPYHDYYIWQEGKTKKNGKELPPNNWQSMFTGSAWEKCPENGQYYLHLFTRKQVDLNYRNPKVIEEVKKILRYWLDLGASGFRCDVINMIYKESFADGKPAVYKRGKEHFLSKPGCHAILKEFNRDVLEPYHAYTVGETADVDIENAKTFTQGELSTVFPFEHTEADYFVLPLWKRKYNPQRMINALIKWQEHIDWNTLFFENHDQPRSLSRFGDEKKYRKESGKMLATVLLTLRGTPFIFEGQEIGMTNVPFNDLSQLRDVSSVNVYNLLRKFRIGKKLAWRWVMNFTRDHARTPMQWKNAQNGGFSEVAPWLMSNPNFTRINVEAETHDTDSIWNYYRTMLALKALTPSLQEGTFKALHLGKKILAFERSDGKESIQIVANMDHKSHRLKSPLRGEKLLGNYPTPLYDGVKKLKPYETVILKIK